MPRDEIDYQEFKRRGSAGADARARLMVCNDRFLIGLPTDLTKGCNESNIMGLRLVKKIGLDARIDE